MFYKIMDENYEVVTTYQSTKERDVKEVLDEQGIEFDVDEWYSTEEIYEADRDPHEMVKSKALLEALAIRFGFDDRGCYGENGWFSAKAVLDFIADYCDEHGMF